MRHTVRFTQEARLALFVAVVAFAIACAGGTAALEPFGSRYRIPLEPNPPTLSATTVSVTLSYGGCRGNHTFALRHRVQAGAASIWLQKTTPDEACDMLVTERREFSLPAAVQAAGSVILLRPEDDPHQLRP